MKTFYSAKVNKGGIDYWIVTEGKNELDIESSVHSLSPGVTIETTKEVDAQVLTAFAGLTT